jgi:hypothetical protein
MTSSPPKSGSLGLGFDLYEDPNTSTAGLWNADNVFGNETIMLDIENSSKHGSMDTHDGPDATALLKMNVGGMTVDFAAMIEEVVSAASKDAVDNEETSSAQKPTPKSPETESQSIGKTPEEPAAE